MSDMTLTIEEQKGVLACLLNHPELYSEVSLDPKEFCDKEGFPNTKSIYTAFLELIDNNTPPDVILMAQKTGMSRAYIQRYFDLPYVVKNIPEYTKTIRDEAIRGELKLLGMSIQSLADTIDDPTSAPLEIEAQLKNIDFTGDVDLVDSSLGSILDRTVAKSEAEKNIPLHERVIQSPFSEFNRRFGGLFMKDYTVLSADTSVGKSVMLSDIISAALDDGYKVGSVILEMDEEQIVQRQIARYSDLTMTDIRKGTYHNSPAMKQSYNNAVRRMRKHRDSWNIYGTDNTSLERILSIGRKMALNGAKLFTVDYLQLVQYEKYAKDRTLAIGLASQAFARLAKSTGMHVIVAAQLNRNFSNRQDKRPMVSDLKESSYVEQSADNIWLLYRDAHYDRESERGNVTEVNVAKGRNIGTGMFEVMWNPETPSYTDLPEMY